MSVAVSTAIAAAAIGAGGSIGGSLIQSHAAGKAVDAQTKANEDAIAFQRETFDKQQENIKPWLDAGKTSLSKLMEGIQNGTFGPGSIKPFAAPTAEEARATPGYQFTRDEGNRGVLSAASANGRSLSGGTLKALDRYNTGLADTTYGDTFQRAIQSYQAQLAGQTQSYNQLAGVSGTGQNAAQNINAAAGQNAMSVGNMMTDIGSARAAGSIASGNAWSQGLTGSTAVLQQILMGQGYNPMMPTINAQGGIGGNALPLPPKPPDYDPYSTYGPG